MIIYPAMNVLGVWKINVAIGHHVIRLSFDNVISAGFVAVNSTILSPIWIEPFLSAHELGINYRARREHRWKLRIIFWASWFALYMPLYVLGQMLFPGVTDIYNLIIVLFLGIILAGGIPMPELDDQKDAGKTDTITD